MRWSTPGTRSVAQSKVGRPFRTIPSPKITADRRSTRAIVHARPDRSTRGPSATGTATPTMKTKRSEEHTSELQSQSNLVCRLLLEKKKKHKTTTDHAH